MILPVRAIGDPVLKRQAADVEQNSEEIQSLIDNMFETMYNSNGIGLAAPQVGISKRIFVVDTNVKDEDGETQQEGIKEAFINPEIEEFRGKDVGFDEGCLSIPLIREDVKRPVGVSVRYLNRDFEEKTLDLDGLLSRVFQHEFDHLEGILFTDRISPIRKRMLKSKLEKIRKGKVDPGYPMKFVK